jgi:hypothetical protein
VSKFQSWTGLLQQQITLHLTTRIKVDHPTLKEQIPFKSKCDKRGKFRKHYNKPVRYIVIACISKQKYKNGKL